METITVQNRNSYRSRYNTGLPQELPALHLLKNSSGFRIEPDYLSPGEISHEEHDWKTDRALVRYCFHFEHWVSANGNGTFDGQNGSGTHSYTVSMFFKGTVLNFDEDVRNTGTVKLHVNKFERWIVPLLHWRRLKSFFLDLLLEHHRKN